MRMICAAIAALVLGVASPAVAEEGAPTESAYARAEAIIAKAGAADLFANDTKPDDTVATVRHRTTGMSCNIPSEATGEINIITALYPRGDDVSCGMNMGAIAVTLYATRRPGASVKEELEGSSQVIRMVHDSVKTWKPSGRAAKIIPADKKPKDIAQGTRWFSFRVEGETTVSRLSVAVVGDWVFKMRASSPEMMAGVMELLTEMVWFGNLNDAAKTRAASAT